MSLDERLLEACSALDFDKVKNLLADDADAGYQDPETGYGPLHRIVLAAKETAGTTGLAQEMVEYVLANGGVWMQGMSIIIRLCLIKVDRNNETPGCLARRLELPELYEAIKMHGVYAEVLLNYVERTDSEADDNDDTTHGDYLKSKLEYDDSAGMLMDDHGAPVMMKWETDIMEKTAEILLPEPGRGRVLNIGFGMGIIDGFLQGRRPESHVIVEAHPAVIERMKKDGWDKKPGVEVQYLKGITDVRLSSRSGKMSWKH